MHNPDPSTWNANNPESWPDCAKCGARCTPTGTGTGYGRVADSDTRYCYRCCADMHRADMINDGRTVLYLTKGADGRDKVTDWTGNLTFSPSYVRHWRGWGFGGWYPCAQAWFTGPDGKPWSIRVQGDMECGRARRLRS